MKEHTTRRTVLAAVAALPALSGTALTAPQPDPIFTAIERHRAACMAVDGLQDPDDDVLDEAVDAEVSQLIILLNSHPATAAGLAALLRHIEWYGHRDDCGLMCNYGKESRVKRAANGFLSLVADQLEALAVRS